MDEQWYFNVEDLKKNEGFFLVPEPPNWLIRNEGRVTA